MKVQGSFESLLRGVSEQPADNRLPGQCEEQINLIPDPVSGLTRRPGSQWQASYLLSGRNDDWDLDLINYRTFSYEHDGEAYDLLIRRKAKPAGSSAPTVLVYKHSDSTFLATSEGWDNTWKNGGISAVTAIGKYVIFAGNDVVPAATSTDKWGDATNQGRAALWVRGGAYSRTFTVTATLVGGSTVTFSYTTPASSYQGLLDTRSVPVFIADPAGGSTVDVEPLYIRAAGAGGEAVLAWADWSPSSLSVATSGGTSLLNVHPLVPSNVNQYAWDTGTRTLTFHSGRVGATDIRATYTHNKTVANPNYAKTVSDLTSEYNAAVTNWIGTAAAAIQPAAIAEQLRAASNTAGLPATRRGSTVTWDNVTELRVSDGGDGSLLRAVDNEVNNIDQLSTVHYIGKTVKVRPNGGGDAFYMIAESMQDAVTSGVNEVRWVEGPGVEHNVITGLSMGTVDAGVFYITADLTSAPPVSGPLTNRPQWVKSTAGDAEGSPLPFFVNRKITYLDVFQDRLIIGSAGVVRASRIGDYLNLFRGSMLTVLADDAFEVTSLGNESDTLRHGVKYDQNLMIFGDKRQYIMPGRVALSPTNALMPVISSHKGAANTAPIEAGGLVFYAKHGERNTSAFQIEPGRNPESPEAYPISDHLDSYLRGKAIEQIALPKPTALVIRTDGAQQSVFVYSYLDSADGRKQGAWHRFDYNQALGKIVGISNAQGEEGFLVYFIRTVLDAFDTAYHTVTVDYQSMVASTSERPYLDSLSQWPNPDSIGCARGVNSGAAWAAAFDGTTARKNVGTTLPLSNALAGLYPEAAGTMMAGALYDSTWIPTNPAPADQRGRAILTGVCTVASLSVAVTDCGGLDSEVTGEDTYEFNGRLVGDPGNLIGHSAIATGTLLLPVGKERREYTHTIKSRGWQPMAITSVNWTGQLFNRSPRL